MHWRLPSHVEKDCSSYAPPITDEDLDRFCRGHLRSTYQYDFTGLPQGQSADFCILEHAYILRVHDIPPPSPPPRIMFP